MYFEDSVECYELLHRKSNKLALCRILHYSELGGRKLERETVSLFMIGAVNVLTDSCIVFTIQSVDFNSLPHNMKMEKFKNCLVWLRNDLRFHDNEVENASVTGIF